jgi:Bacteriophage abortive infection AbiH
MNVLIVGNGFDRKLGLKTDYFSFLEWMKKEGYGVGSKFLGYSEKIYLRNINSPFEGRLQDYKDFADISENFRGEKFNIQNLPQNKYFDVPQENFMANSFLYLLPEIISDNIQSKTENPNIWYTFIQLLQYEKKHKLFNLNISNFEKYLGDEGNWVDIEGLIQKSIEIRIQQDYYKQGIFSISNYFDVFSLANLLVMDINKNHQRRKEDIYEIVWRDFLEFKMALVDYLSFTSSSINSLQESFLRESDKHRVSSNEKAFTFININQYNKIINFNYVPFILTHDDVYYVHGDIMDNDNIVFGLDVNLKNSELNRDERKTVFEINLYKNKRLLKFSKLHQLLHLQVDKDKNKLGVVNSITIVGHSIGEQDYSYYFSILERNIDNIEIICLWYEFNEGGNNKESLKEDLLEMLFSFEKYSNKRILHKMIFEGRIKFRKTFIPQIIN